VKKFLAISTGLFLTVPLFSQKIDSIFFHLYSDSLKKGQHNYINVDAKLSNGRWQPLTDKEIQFTSSEGKFDGNELILPMDFKSQKITVKAVLKSNPAIWKETTIWVKKLPDPERLPTNEEILGNKPTKKNRS
jgi:hypothetical protein